MTMSPANDNGPPADVLDTLLTPEQIAERIKASAGVTLAPRTIWEKARRIGVSLKIGRSMLISSRDIPKLLQEENRKWPSSINEERSGISPSLLTVIKPGEALALLRKNRLKNSRTKK